MPSKNDEFIKKVKESNIEAKESVNRRKKFIDEVSNSFGSTVQNTERARILNKNVSNFEILDQSEIQEPIEKE